MRQTKSQPPVYARKGEKNLWHPYGLQGLRPDRLVIVADRIMCGRYKMLSLRFGDRQRA